MISDNTSINDHDFVSQYAALSDDEINELASEGGLRPEADIALREEMHKRSIGAAEVQSLRVRQSKAKLQMTAGHNPTDRGTGLSLQGHKFLTEADREKGITVATRWIVFVYMPLIPIGSYRVRKHLNATPEIVGQVPLQWDQVFEGWKKAALVVLGIVGALLGIVLWERLQGR